MSVKRRTLSAASGILARSIKIAGGSRATQIAAQMSEELTPTVCQSTPHGDICFYSPGVLPEWRARTLLTKEPETLEWLDGFGATDVLWDIGANVGVYSLYAAAKGCAVLAFEPAPGNYFLLSRNIEINGMDDRVLAYCVAFSDDTGLDTFYMANTELGGALNSFGTSTDWQGKPLEAQLRQAMVGFSIDDFVEQFDPQVPNHIKIDVDGIEDRIIAGATRTLADERVKSVLVELDTERTEYCEGVVRILEGAGLTLEKKEHGPELEQGEFSAVYNHIFTRSS